MRSQRAWAAILCFSCICIFAASALGIELREKTLEAFNHYIALTEKRMAGELENPSEFLWIDRQPIKSRDEFYGELLSGAIIVQHLETRENSARIPIPGGLVHHWVALVFVPGVTLSEVLAFMQDYNNQQNIYAPDIQRTRLLSRDGDDFKIYMRLYRKAIVTAVFNAEFDVQYFSLDSSHAYSRSYSTRLAEVVDPGKPTEHEKPVGYDRGFLWRLDTYSNFEEKDGGVYIQEESIALSRPVPVALAWLVNPYLKSIPRDYMTHLLQVTRRALTATRPPGK